MFLKVVELAEQITLQDKKVTLTHHPIQTAYVSLTVHPPDTQLDES